MRWVDDRGPAARPGSSGRRGLELVGAATLGLVVLVLLLWAVPSWLTRDPRLSVVERYDAMADVRTGLFTALGALGVVGGLVYTAMTFRLSTRTFRLSMVAHLSESFQAAAAQVGDGNPTVRLAGVHALAQLADEWASQRQTCIDVLCAYLRTAGAAPVAAERSGPGADRDREVRRTVVDVIRSRLTEAPSTSWRGYDFDLTGAHLDVADFRDVRFTFGRFVFDEVTFGGDVRFDRAVFAGADVRFCGARFQSGRTTFDGARFDGGVVRFDGARFTGGTVSFAQAAFRPGCQVTFADAALGVGGTVTFAAAGIDGPAEPSFASTATPALSFAGARFAEGAGDVSFDGACLTGSVPFDDAEFDRPVSFAGADLSAAELSFRRIRLGHGGRLSFHGAHCSGGTFVLDDASGDGGCLDMTQADGRPRVSGAELDRPPLFCPPGRQAAAPPAPPSTSTSAA